MTKNEWLFDLQLFAGEGAGDGGGEGAAESGESAPAAEESRLRELGVPEAVLRKRANRAAKAARAVPAPAEVPEAPEANTETNEGQQTDAAKESAPSSDNKRMTWDEIMADPEYNKAMQETVQKRLRNSKDAEDKLSKLTPALELISRKYGLDPSNLDADALTKAVSDDESYYEDVALKLGVPVEQAKRIDQDERETARIEREKQQTIEQQRIINHIEGLKQQGEQLKKQFPAFDLMTELRNPAFARMTSPNGGVSVEDAYYAVHRKEIMSAANNIVSQRTAQMISNSIRSGQGRPAENGTSSQAPSVSTFDYAKASKDQREELKRKIRMAAARGEKIYPGK